MHLHDWVCIFLKNIIYLSISFYKTHDHLLDWNHSYDRYRYYIVPRDILSLKNRNNMLKFWITSNYCILYRNISNFQQFLGKLLPRSLQMLVPWPLFSLKWWYPDMLSLSSKKYVEILNNVWIITFYIGKLEIFSNFGGNFCLAHSSRWLCDQIFARNHGRKRTLFRKTQKIVQVLKTDENVWRKLPKTDKF